MQGDLRISPYSAPCGSCPEKGCGAKHTTCEAYIAFRKKADKYKRDKQKAMARNASTRGCMRTLHDQDKAVFAHHIQSDIVLDIIKANAAEIKAMMEGVDDGTD